MIVRKSLYLPIVVRIAWKRVLSLLLVSSAVVAAEYHGVLENWRLSPAPASIIGTALAILIGFRVNNAYDRWWEARRIWGALVNDSRTFARQVLSFTPADQQGRQRSLILGQVGFVHALRMHLRKQPLAEEIAPFFHADELASFADRRNVPNAILERQSAVLASVFAKMPAHGFQDMQLDNTLNRLCDSLGACERIKNTVFPRQYSVYSSLFIAGFSYMLPFFLVKDTGMLVILLTVIVGFMLASLDLIAKGIENPFENTVNDTPMTALCITIEADLKQMMNAAYPIGEGLVIPDAVQPENGFLY